MLMAGQRRYLQSGQGIPSAQTMSQPEQRAALQSPKRIPSFGVSDQIRPGEEAHRLPTRYLHERSTARLAFDFVGIVASLPEFGL